MSRGKLRQIDCKCDNWTPRTWSGLHSRSTKSRCSECLGRGWVFHPQDILDYNPLFFGLFDRAGEIAK
jgi:hypothetical protein